MFKRNKKENKAKLEHKLYLARENPEPVFDISDCGISSVPAGIYSLCRVFLKESLNLSGNYINSLSGGGNLKDLHLLKVLDLRNNSISGLPDEISSLKSLKELHLSNNQLKKLPSSLCSLEKLKVLDVSNNNLKALPENIGDLTRLESLNISGNKDLKTIPKSICKAQKINNLIMDGVKFSYPPAEIAMQGTEAVMKFISNDVGVEYKSPSDLVDSPDSQTSNSTLDAYKEDEIFQAKIWKLEKLKEQKLQEYLEIERQNDILQQQEIELANAQKENRKKLLSDIAQQQNKFDIELNKLQQKKDMERYKLIEQLQATERNAEMAITKLLSLNSEPLTQLLELEKEEERKLIAAANKYNESLRKNDILMDMQELLEDEYKKFKKFDEERLKSTQCALEQDELCDTKIAEVLKNKDVEQFQLLSKLQEDNDLQKFAVGALLERGDARSWGLVQQVRLVESQLAALTLIEIDRRKLQIDDHINDLAENRANLSVLLMDLLDQQHARRAQLLSTLQSLEDTNTSADDFWLKQYQRLLDKLPTKLSEAQKNINPQLAEALLMAGVIHCLPFLLKFVQNEENLLDINEDDLKNAGVNKSEERKQILHAFSMFKKLQYIHSTNTLPIEGPSAPSVECTSNITTTNSTSECVVCLDENCEIIFVPCGHFCTCLGCAGSLIDCPLCRGNIERKIKVVGP